MNDARINLSKAAPTLYQALVALDRLAAQSWAGAGLTEGFAHLLRLRASQINQCAYCVRLHARDAAQAGETPDRIALLTAWRESDYFDEAERAALALVEAITRISDGQVPAPIYQEATRTLTQDQVVAVEWLAVAINAWNRVAISSRNVVKP